MVIDSFEPPTAVEGGDHVCSEQIVPVQAKPLQVIVHKGNFDRAFRAFRSMVQKERILSLYKEKGAYEKPSVKKRRKRSAAARERQLQKKLDLKFSK